MTEPIIAQIIIGVAKLRPDVVPFLSERAKSVINPAHSFVAEEMSEVKATDSKDVQKQRQKREAEIKARLAAALSKARAQVLQHKSYSQPELRAALTAALRVSLAEIANEQAQSAASGVSFGFDPTAVDRTVQAWAKQYTYDLIKDLNDNTLQTVRDAVSAFTSTPGMTNADLEALLEPAFGEVRAEMITVTEVTRAYAQGEAVFQDMMQQDGIETVREWLTSEDEKVCPICSALDGRKAKPGEGFGDGIDNPPAHPNCRCGVQTRLVY